jgi:hypothetical protein
MHRFLQPPFANDVLIDLLNLSRFFLADSTEQLAIHHINSRKWHFHPAQLIHLCFKFRISVFFESAFARLVDIPFRELTPDQKELITPAVFYALAEVKESLELHKHIIAAEPPPIINHAPDCPNPKRCSADWYAVWWNGMARFILDGRNPLTYDEAFKRFEILGFGEMGHGCKKDMLALVKGGNGFRHAQYTVDVAGARLAASLSSELM